MCVSEIFKSKTLIKYFRYVVHHYYRYLVSLLTLGSPLELKP